MLPPGTREVPGHPDYCMAKNGTLYSRWLRYNREWVRGAWQPLQPQFKFRLGGIYYSFKRLYVLVWPEGDWRKVTDALADDLLEAKLLAGTLRPAGNGLFVSLGGEIWAEPDPLRTGLKKGWMKLRISAKGTVKHRLKRYRADDVVLAAFPKGLRAAQIERNTPDYPEDDSDIPT